jgi:hypothetical protein
MYDHELHQRDDARAAGLHNDGRADDDWRRHDNHNDQHHHDAESPMHDDDSSGVWQRLLGLQRHRMGADFFLYWRLHLWRELHSYRLPVGRTVVRRYLLRCLRQLSRAAAAAHLHRPMFLDWLSGRLGAVRRRLLSIRPQSMRLRVSAANWPAEWLRQSGDDELRLPVPQRNYGQPMRLALYDHHNRQPVRHGLHLELFDWFVGQEQ